MKNIILFGLLAGICIFTSCKKEDTTTPPTLQLNLGGSYVSDGATLAISDSIAFGIHAEGMCSSITYFKVEVQSDSGTSTVYEEGMNTDVFDAEKVFFKGIPDKETFIITVMDYYGNAASESFTVFRDSSSGFGAIYHYSNITIGYQGNTTFGHFLDPNTGLVYDETSVTGNEDKIHIVSYYYLSSGSPSPTLVCPAQTDAQTQYPAITGWSVQNSTLYDYHTSDYDLISAAQFDACSNDSLLIVAYNSTYTNMKCKFALTGKIVPFMTAQGKKGLLKVVSADQSDTGSMTLDIKIQQ